MFNLKRIIGLSVVAIKGETNAKGKNIEPKYILFSDGKTVIELEQQDYYMYHDCSSSARYINIHGSTDAGVHENFYNHIMSYPDATIDI